MESFLEELELGLKLIRFLLRFMIYLLSKEKKSHLSKSLHFSINAQELLLVKKGICSFS